MNLRKTLNLTLRDFAGEMKTDFPNVSPAFISAAERSETTGVKFTPQFEKTARARFGCVKNQVKRKKPNRITVWLTDEQMDFVLWAIPRWGASSKSDLLGRFVNTEMRFSKYKKAASSVGALSAASENITNQA